MTPGTFSSLGRCETGVKLRIPTSECEIAQSLRATCETFFFSPETIGGKTYEK